MARTEIGGVAIERLDDIDKMPSNAPNERVFARLLREKTTLQIDYEPTRFDYTDSEGRTVTTIPDFRVVNPKTGVTTYIEITSSLNGKDRQRQIMESSAPGTNYRVFCAGKLYDIQEKFPEYSFSHLEQEA